MTRIYVLLHGFSVTGVTSCTEKVGPVDNLFDGLQGHGGLAFDPNRSRQWEIMAKRKKASKLQKKKGVRARPKARKVAKAAKATKRTVAKAKPKAAPAKKATQQEAIAPAIETLVDTTEIREESEPKPPSLI